MQHWMPLLLISLLVFVTRPAWAREYVVDGSRDTASDDNAGTEEQPLKSISKAAEMARPGDTIRVRAGTYREAVLLANSGKPGAPIIFLADPPGSVVITGADVIAGWERVPGQAPVYRVAWPHQFIIDWRDGKPVEHHPADAPRWGRAEQVIADGMQLVPAENLEKLMAAWRDRQGQQFPLPAADSGSAVPNPEEPASWYGMFAADTAGRCLYVWLADGSDPSAHRVEAATRGLIFGTDPWRSRDGVQHVQVCGFVFRYGATFPQRAAVWLHGRRNLLEECIIEEMAGTGVNVNGSMRRCVVRRCGHTGGGARGSNFLNEDCLWEHNCWKPIDRGWDAGGFKIARCDGGVFRHCVFRRNGGPGLWMDIDVRNVLVTECVFQENENSGLFIEISRDIAVLHNLCVGNATAARGRPAHVDWSCAGIQVAESKNCIVAFNTCVGNKDGIGLREQGPRVLETEEEGQVTYYNRGHVVWGNVCAFNQGYQLGLWYDNGFFGWHPSEKERFGTEAAYEEYLKTTPDEVYDPTKQGMLFDRNVYFAAPGQSLVLYGVPWRAKHKAFSELPQFAAATAFDAHSRTADPLFENAKAGDYGFRPDSPARNMQVGWVDAPRDVDEWMSVFLPAFR